MTHTLFGIGATTTAIALTAAFVTAQGAAGQEQAGGPPAVQGQAPPQQQGQMGPGRLRANGPRRGLGQQVGPQAGRGGRQPAAPGRGRGQGVNAQARGRGGAGRFAALGLTQDQRAAITDLQRATRDQAAPLEDELGFTRKTLHRELFADTRDNAKVASLTSKIATLEKALADLHVKQTTAVADLLTPEQRETMRLAEGRGVGRGRGPGRPGAGRGRGGVIDRVPSDTSGGSEPAGR